MEKNEIFSGILEVVIDTNRLNELLVLVSYKLIG